MPRASQKQFSWITSQISFTSSKLLFISNNQCNYSVFFLKITSKIQANKYSTIAYDIVLVLPVVIYCIILYSIWYCSVSCFFNARICMKCFCLFYFFPFHSLPHTKIHYFLYTLRARCTVAWLLEGGGGGHHVDAQELKTEPAGLTAHIAAPSRFIVTNGLHIITSMPEVSGPLIRSAIRGLRKR